MNDGAPMGVEPRLFTVEGAPARVFIGGEGPPILLVHGGWGCAAVHWAPVWGRLAQRFRVIAPDLPGIGTSEPGLASYAVYARWLVHLLDAADVGTAWLVGNSLGASVAWRLAGDFPERCRGLVLVNGFPVPRTPRPLLWLGRSKLGRALMRGLMRRVSYTPAALARGFAHPAKAPVELVTMLNHSAPAPLTAVTDCVIGGDGGVAPTAPTLLLWGEADRLPGTSARKAARLHCAIPSSELVFVAGAGHFPQVEQPAQFAHALEEFVHECGG